LKTETVSQPDTREYERSSAVVFLRTKEAFGGLSNMAGGFPLRVNGVRIATSEALYQACRFPHRPEVQRLVIEQTSPMTAKMKTKPYRADTRPDWDRVRTKIMRWCLRVKLAQNYSTFSRLLLSTGECPIVEESRKDGFWGAKPVDGGRLVGMNVLGRLLMELRKELREFGRSHLQEILPLNIPEFLLFDQPIEPIQSPVLAAAPSEASTTPSPHALLHTADMDRVDLPRAAPDKEPVSRVTTPNRKKLIEVSIPLEAINVASAREKSIRHGHPSTLHLWWARRPLAACRAVLFAQLVDDPSSWPDRYPPEGAQDAERKRLHDIIKRMVPWEASNDQRILNEARWEIARSVAWGLGEEPPPKNDSKAILDYLQTKAPPVYDPFCGGGSIPLEAQRLGLRAYGSDLNPVAVLISKALVEIPPKFTGLPPVNPKAHAELKRGGRWNGKGAQGLAEDVRYYGQWMRDEAEKRIGHLYPKAKLPDEPEATVIAWVWARTVRSPDPSAKGAMVPLVSSFMLSTKDGKKAWVEPVIEPAARDGWRFEVRTGALSKLDEERLKKGTKSAKGQAFVCILTGSAIARPYIQAEGKADRLGQRLMAIVAERSRGRQYITPTTDHEDIPRSAEIDPNVADARAGFLSGPTPTRAMITGGVCSAYGLKTWAHLFTPRQLLALTTFSTLVGEVHKRTLADARAANFGNDEVTLHLGGTGATAYADAIATYVCLSLDRAAMAGNSLVRWNGVGEKAQHSFGRQAFGMVWDFAEPNFFADATGSLSSCYEMTVNGILFSNSNAGNISALAAQRNNYPANPIIISTDPPYFDNVAYAELSEFFYPWLKRSLSAIWPNDFRRIAVPREDELVATPLRHGGKAEAEAFFMKGMGEALVAMRNAATDTDPLTIYYAFKQSEAAEDGITSAGWASFLQAMVDAGLAIDGTWPLRTEMATRMVGQGANALASSIVLVCRKRSSAAAIVTRAEFIRALKREMPGAIDDIRKAGVGPVDMQQSVIGPGMGIFTRYAKVLEDDDRDMSVRTALALINRAWEEIENELETNFDAETQVALAWFSTYGFDPKPSGELITLANAKNIPLNALFSSKVFQDHHGKAGLTPRVKLAEDWEPPTDRSPTVWECLQHIIRVLKAEVGGGEAAGRLIAQMGPKATEARLLAERLYQIAAQKGWQQEALVYNELAEEWPALEEFAQNITTLDRDAEPAQARLL
jgi:putative DNA methylase